MAKARPRLSAAKVRSIREPGKYYDENGLYLRVEPSLSKRWVQRLTIHGRQRELGLGSADLVSLAEAREAAFQNRKLARAGGDPLADRRSRMAIPTFDEAVERVIELYSPTWTNAKHAAQFRNTLKTYANPTLGRKSIAEISTADVLRVLQPIWFEKAETARRVKQRIGTVMKWGIAQGFRSDDATVGVIQALPKSKREAQHRRSMHYNEVADCIAAVRSSQAMLSTKLAIEFLVLTAARSGEVRGARWEEVDLQRATWTVPASRMKTKAEHVVPLSRRAIEILREAQTLSTGALIFPGMKSGRPMSDMTMSKLVKELGFETDIHGFRTSFRVWSQERADAPFEVAEKALAHKTANKVVAAYARSDLFEKRRELMQLWSDHLVEQRSDV